MTRTGSRGTLSGSTNGTLENSVGNCLITCMSLYIYIYIYAYTISILVLGPYYEQDAGVHHGTIMQGLAGDNARSCSGFYIGC